MMRIPLHTVGEALVIFLSLPWDDKPLVPVWWTVSLDIFLEDF